MVVIAREIKSGKNGENSSTVILPAPHLYLRLSWRFLRFSLALYASSDHRDNSALVINVVLVTKIKSSCDDNIADKLVLFISGYSEQTLKLDYINFELLE
jgi:hypothetical protein